MEHIHLDDHTLEFELPKQFLEYSSFAVLACGWQANAIPAPSAAE